MSTARGVWGQPRGTKPASSVNSKVLSDDANANKSGTQLSDSAIVVQSQGAGGDTPSAEDPSQWIYGATIKVVTLSGEEIVGEVYTVDPMSSAVVLRLPNTSRATLPSIFDYRIIKERFIKSTTYLHNATPDAVRMPDPAYVCLEDVDRREAKAKYMAQEAIQKIGVGVSDKAQQVFNTISKTLKCQWRGQDIVVLDIITIAPPYTAESCSALPGSKNTAKAMGQIKLMLEDEARTSGHAQ